MLGISIGLIVSWAILYVFERRSILALGLSHLRWRLGQLMIGFFITTILCAGIELTELLLRGSSLYVNENLRFLWLFERFWWDFKSVLTEELVFRGALLYLLMARLDTQRGILISAMAFGVYHWFSFGIFGSIVPMVIVFLGTGLMGYAWALAFAKTGSILMPIGFHLGWNFTLNTIFSKGPLGEGVLISAGGDSISDWYSLVGLLGAPLLVLLIVHYWIPRGHASR